MFIDIALVKVEGPFKLVSWPCNSTLNSAQIHNYAYPRTSYLLKFLVH